MIGTTINVEITNVKPEAIRIGAIIEHITSLFLPENWTKIGSCFLNGINVILVFFWNIIIYIFRVPSLYTC